MDEQRGIGTTTNQMHEAPRGAVYVWCNAHLRYPRDLARSLGRDDLEIVSPDWIRSERWRGRRLSGLVIDHATRLHGEAWDLANEIRARAPGARQEGE